MILSFFLGSSGKHCRSRTPDLVITDIRMPGMEAANNEGMGPSNETKR
ncbi:hypothetical protein [Novipirellula artificiosorum]|uniref:Uncharacterized protein n=1 Tax=Novipirellula artificiosorum TaxID=2528016 RepID=A0A5C6E613_9BACT|nr:hypothetical protein [Novipirellula artificiosorum]TWU42569.1 hypothetical protein Poly41_08660 [Novipirellula artificiosorum]